MPVTHEAHRAATVAANPHALRAALAVRGLTQQDLAQRAGLSEATISKALQGGPITGPTFARIARALSATPVVTLDGIGALLAVGGPNDGPSGHESAASSHPELTAGWEDGHAAASSR